MSILQKRVVYTKYLIFKSAAENVSSEIVDEILNEVFKRASIETTVSQTKPDAFEIDCTQPEIRVSPTRRATLRENSGGKFFFSWIFNFKSIYLSKRELNFVTNIAFFSLSDLLLHLL